MTLKKLLAQAIIFWAVVTLTIMYFIDFKLPAAIAISDYLMTFHTAGWIAAHRQMGDTLSGRRCRGFSWRTFRSALTPVAADDARRLSFRIYVYANERLGFCAV